MYYRKVKNIYSKNRSFRCKEIEKCDVTLCYVMFHPEIYNLFLKYFFLLQNEDDPKFWLMNEESDQFGRTFMFL